ncbi:hypothetical protein D3C72_695160 [compost metagenome]
MARQGLAALPGVHGHQGVGVRVEAAGRKLAARGRGDRRMPRQHGRARVGEARPAHARLEHGHQPQGRLAVELGAVGHHGLGREPQPGLGARMQPVPLHAEPLEKGRGREPRLSAPEGRHELGSGVCPEGPGAGAEVPALARGVGPGQRQIRAAVGRLDAQHPPAGIAVVEERAQGERVGELDGRAVRALPGDRARQLDTTESPSGRDARHQRAGAQRDGERIAVALGAFEQSLAHQRAGQALEQGQPRAAEGVQKARHLVGGALGQELAGAALGAGQAALAPLGGGGDEARIEGGGGHATAPWRSAAMAKGLATAAKV